MANEFYQPIAYPTYQFAKPYDPIAGAIDAYSAGLGIRQQKQQMEAQKQQMELQKQQMELQKQQAEMQKQQMEMSQQRLDMEQRREIREARRADLEETMKKMEMEPKMELMGISKSYQQIVNQNPGLPLEQRYKMALDAAKSSKFPQTVEAVKKYIMMDMEDKYPNSELRAKAENLVFGTTVTPEQIEARDMEMVKGKWGAAGYSKTGKKLFEVTSDVQKRAEERAQAGLGMEQQRLEIAKTRAAEGRGSTPGSIAGVKALSKDLKTLDGMLSQAEKLEAQADLAETKPGDFMTMFGLQGKGTDAVKKQQDVLRARAKTIRERAKQTESLIADTYTLDELNAAVRGNLGIRQRVPGLFGAEPSPAAAPAPAQPAASPHAAAKAALLAPAAGPIDETARLQAIASSPVDSPERRAARIRLAELAQQSGQFRYAPPAMPARQQLTTPQPIGWGTKWRYKVGL